MSDKRGWDEVTGYSMHIKKKKKKEKSDLQGKKDETFPRVKRRLGGTMQEMGHATSGRIWSTECMEEEKDSLSNRPDVQEFAN